MEVDGLGELPIGRPDMDPASPKHNDRCCPAASILPMMGGYETLQPPMHLGSPEGTLLTTFVNTIATDFWLLPRGCMSGSPHSIHIIWPHIMRLLLCCPSRVKCSGSPCLWQMVTPPRKPRQLQTIYVHASFLW